METTLNTGTSAEDQVMTSSELVEKIEIKDTPFTLVKENGDVIGFIALGNYVVSQKEFKTETECSRWLKKNMFHIMWKIAAIVVEINNNQTV